MLFNKYAGSDSNITAEELKSLIEEVTVTNPTLLTSKSLDTFYHQVKDDIDHASGKSGLTLERFKASIAKVMMVEAPKLPVAPASRDAGPLPKRIKDSLVVQRKIVMQSDCDDHECLMASSTLKWIDLTALACAWRHAEVAGL